MLDFVAAAGYPPMEQGTPAVARAGMRAMSVDMVKPEDVVPVGSVEDLKVPGGAGEREARLYRPEGDGPGPTLVYLHGGGFVIGDLDTHDQTCRRICRDADVAVLSVDYRLAPEHPFPAGLEDALAATEWAAAHLADLGGGDRLAVGGDSAGGNLSAVVAQHLGESWPRQFLIYPATDGVGDYPSKAENGEGFFLTAGMMEWFSGHYVGPTSTSRPSCTGSRRCTATSPTGARRWSSPPSSTRCATRARRTPTRCAPPASTSSRCATTG